MADLTNYGVQDPTSGETTYGPMAKIAKLVAALSAKTAEPAAAKLPAEEIQQQPIPGPPQPDPEAGQASPGADLQGSPQALYQSDGSPAPKPNQALTSPPASASPISGATQFENVSTAPQPKVAKPSFQQASTDSYGNVVPGAGLTKLGRLLTILRGGVQGGIDAV